LNTQSFLFFYKAQQTGAAAWLGGAVRRPSSAAGTRSSRAGEVAGARSSRWWRSTAAAEAALLVRALRAEAALLARALAAEATPRVRGGAGAAGGSHSSCSGTDAERTGHPGGGGGASAARAPVVGAQGLERRLQV